MGRQECSHHHESAQSWKSLEHLYAAANAREGAAEVAFGGLPEEQRSAYSEYEGIRSRMHVHFLVIAYQNVRALNTKPSQT